MATVQCVVLEREAEALDAPPYPGKLGQRIVENVSKEGWTQWLERLVLIINENQLSSADPENLDLIEQHMVGFLFGEGDLGDPGQPRGDLLVLFHTEAPPEGWERDGKDMHRLMPLDLADAVLGTQLQVEGLREPITLKVPAGTREGDTLPVANQGLDDVNGGRRGQVVFHVNLKVPKNLNRKQRKAWEALRSSLN